MNWEKRVCCSLTVQLDRSQTRMQYIHFPLLLWLKLNIKYFCATPFSARFLLLFQDRKPTEDLEMRTRHGILLLKKKGATQKCLMTQRYECGAFVFETFSNYVVSDDKGNNDMWLEKS